MAKFALFGLAFCMFALSGAFGEDFWRASGANDVDFLGDTQWTGFSEDAQKSTRAFEQFLTALDSETYEVDFYEDAVKALLPSIERLHTIFSEEYSDSNTRDRSTVAFRQLTKQINQIDVAISRILFEQPPTDDERVLQFYKDQRAPIASVEENVRLLAMADSSKDRQYYLRSLRDECRSNNPGRFFFDRTQRSRDRSLDRAEALSKLTESQDRASLTSWVKLIAGDAVRAMSLHQACLAVAQPPVSQSRVDKFVEGAWKKIKEIFDDLEREADRLQKIWEKQSRDVSEVINRELFQFNEQSKGMDVVRIVEQALSAKYTDQFFGVFVLTGPFVKKVFKRERVLEVPFGKRTLLVVSNDKSKQNADRQREINAYVERVPCTDPEQQEKYQEKSLQLAQDKLRKLGATAVYVTDSGYTSRAFPQVSVGVREKCDALYGANKLPWKYTRSFIVGY